MQVGLGPGHIVLDGDPALFLRAHVCYGLMAALIKMPLGMEVDLGPGDFVLDGDPAPRPQKGGGDPLPNFWPMYIVAKRLHAWIKTALGMEMGLGPGHIMLDGDPDALSKKGGVAPYPIFGPFLVARCIKMPLGMEVGLSPGDFVLDGDPAPFPKGERSPPIFGPCILGGRPRPRQRCVRWGRSSPLKGAHLQFSVHVYCGQMTGWMKAPLCTEVDLGPGHILLDGDPAPRRKGHSSPSLFGPCLLWPRSPISATAELLLKIIILWPNLAQRPFSCPFGLIEVVLPAKSTPLMS